MKMCSKCGKPQIDKSYTTEMLRVYNESYKAGISPLVCVVKCPTSNGVLRRLDLLTVELLESVGYKIFDYHRALLFVERTQRTLDGEQKKIPKGRLSFFKRLSYQRGNAVSHWEDVIIAVIPEEYA